MEMVEPQNNVSVCLACGYRDGFHVAIDTKDASERGRIHLICPACHQHFDPGWDIVVRKRP